MTIAIENRLDMTQDTVTSAQCNGKCNSYNVNVSVKQKFLAWQK